MQHEYWRYQEQEIADARVIRNREKKAKGNYESAMEFEEAMFNWRSRHLIIVLTLEYEEQWAPFVSFDDLRRDRDRLFNNMRSNSLLQGINGYIWKLEEGGPTVGHHMHLVLFYDRSSHGDIYIGDLIGKYWVKVIAGVGRGAFNNSNRNKDKYELGQWGNATGTIDRNDYVKRTSLRTFLGEYIAKDDQHVAARMNTRYRTFGTSQVPS